MTAEVREQGVPLGEAALLAADAFNAWIEEHVFTPRAPARTAGRCSESQHDGG